MLIIGMTTVMSFGQKSTYEIISVTSGEIAKQEQTALTSEWVDQYRLNDVDRIIRFESGSVYSLKSRVILGLSGAAEYYADQTEYPNYFVIRNSRMEPSVKLVKAEAATEEVSKEKELSDLTKRIESIEIKYAYVKNDPAQREAAESQGWFTQMDELLTELKKKKISLESEMKH